MIDFPEMIPLLTLPEGSLVQFTDDGFRAELPNGDLKIFHFNGLGPYMIDHIPANLEVTVDIGSQ